MDAIGYPMKRETITKIERGGTRANASLSDVLALAVALGSSPVHLLAPREDDRDVAVTPKLPLAAPDARAWIRGERPLPGSDFTAWFAELPAAEQQKLMESYLAHGLTPLDRGLLSEDIQEEALTFRERVRELADDNAWDHKRDERIRRGEQRAGALEVADHHAPQRKDDDAES